MASKIFTGSKGIFSSSWTLFFLIVLLSFTKFQLAVGSLTNNSALPIEAKWVELQRRFVSVCFWHVGKPSEKAEVEAIGKWAKKSTGAKTCSGVWKSLIEATRIEMENANLTELHFVPAALRLKSLYLAENQMSNIDSIVHSNLANSLEVLDLRGNKIKKIAQDAFFPRLRILNLSANSVGEFGFLKASPELWELNLHDVSLYSLDNIPDLPALISLGVSRAQLKDLDGIERFPNLKYLYAPGNQLQSLKRLWQLPYLEVLHAQRNPLIEWEICLTNSVKCYL
jgi:hypothetical protein